jgi:hypothetical protein
MENLLSTGTEVDGRLVFPEACTSLEDKRRVTLVRRVRGTGMR